MLNMCWHVEPSICGGDFIEGGFFMRVRGGLGFIEGDFIEGVS
jgi:hypothetical protein